MKRFLTLALTLTLCASFSPAAAFSDVSPGDWYAGSVAFCQETGLMTGTSAESFSPSGTLTLAEVMTAAARLHYRTHGGTGAFPTAPEVWGSGSLLTPGGAVLLEFDTCEGSRGLSYLYGAETPRQLHLFLEVSGEELRALTPAGGPANAVLTLNGRQVLTGGLAPTQDGSMRVEFVADAASDYNAFNREYASFLPAPASNLWYRDALWYVRENAMLDAQPMDTAFEAPATRLDLAEWLYSALPIASLVPINAVDALPDALEPEVLELYRAGILTGVDARGSFGGEQTLTRAELAVVLARAIDPARRVQLNAAPTT